MYSNCGQPGQLNNNYLLPHTDLHTGLLCHILLYTQVHAQCDKTHGNARWSNQC